MAPKVINILISTFNGLGLPPTLALHLPETSTTTELLAALSWRLPPVTHRLILTTTTNKLIYPTSTPLSTFLASPNDTLVSLRLSAPLCGGKGGFGSQLRAAGGRMSSRKRKRGADANGSNRNLDGRRLRTVTEAKALAEYLAVKPDMDKREREERRKRWEAVVEAADSKEEEIRLGKGKAKVDEGWVEMKEEVESKTREAVLAALRKGEIKSVLGRVVESESERSGEASGDESESDEEGSANLTEGTGTVKTAQAKTFFGWDEDDEMSDEDEKSDDEMSEDDESSVDDEDNDEAVVEQP